MKRTRLVCGLLLAASLLATACGGIPCECDSDVIPLPVEGAWEISDIRVEDHYDGGASDEWDWESSSPWGDVHGGELRKEGDTLFVEYSTDQGTFLVELEQSSSDGW